MFDREHDARVRAAAFEWLRARETEHGDTLPRTVLAKGFEYRGDRVPLLGPQGIFKPRVLHYPLSITTSPNGPYDDGITQDGQLFYRYRGTDPQHRDNRGLRFALIEGLPLVYFHGVVPSRYVATWPVRIVGDTPGDLVFSVALSTEGEYEVGATTWAGAEPTPLRRYQTSLVRRRVHQGAFRERVLTAYREQCALCHLRHRELLDAAHIIPDSEPDGVPEVRNGLALCRLHHSAFDSLFIGITPDYRIRVRPDLLEEEDGPTLKHAIQGMHDAKLILPRAARDHPDPALLDARYQLFLGQ